MRKLSEFKYYVAITPQEQLAVVMLCPECGMTMSFSDCGSGILGMTTAVQQHQCYQTVVSVPK